MKFREFDLYIFDLDGTLIDSRVDIANAVNSALSAVGLSVWTVDQVTGFIGNGTRALIQRAIHGQDDLFPDTYRRFTEEYGRHLLDETRMYPGVLETLQALRPRKMAVLSNKRQRFCDPIIDGLGIRSYFHDVVGGDRFEKQKPDPMPILKICENIGVPPGRTVMVGDSLADIRAGKAAGAFTIGITTGYGDPSKLREVEADQWLSSVADLAREEEF